MALTGGESCNLKVASGTVCNICDFPSGKIWLYFLNPFAIGTDGTRQILRLGICTNRKRRVSLRIWSRFESFEIVPTADWVAAVDGWLESGGWIFHFVAVYVFTCSPCWSSRATIVWFNYYVKWGSWCNFGIPDAFGHGVISFGGLQLLKGLGNYSVSSFVTIARVCFVDWSTLTDQS